MKIYIWAFAILLPSYVLSEKEESANTTSRSKREPPIYRPATAYGPPLRRPKPVYGPPRTLYGPPRPVYSRYGPPRPIYGPPRPVYGFPFERPRAAYGVPPSTSFQVPSSTYGAPNRYGVPSSSYRPPATYGAPSLIYGPSAPIYGPPTYGTSPTSATYSRPPSSYSAPPESYNPPSQSYLSPPSYPNPLDDYGPPRIYGPPIQNYGPPLQSYPYSYGAQNSYLPSANYGVPLPPIYRSPQQIYSPPSPHYEQTYNSPPFNQPDLSSTYEDTDLEYEHPDIGYDQRYPVGYEVPVTHRPQPLQYDTSSASYGTPGARTSYGTPAVSHEPYFQKRTNSLYIADVQPFTSFEDGEVSSSNRITEKIAGFEATNKSRKITSKNDIVVAQSESKDEEELKDNGNRTLNHNYNGPGIIETLRLRKDLVKIVQTPTVISDSNVEKLKANENRTLNHNYKSPVIKYPAVQQIRVRKDLPTTEGILREKAFLTESNLVERDAKTLDAKKRND